MIIYLIGIFIFVFLFLILPIILGGAPFLPSLRRFEQEYLDEVFKLVEGKKTFIDLGSGDGRIVAEFSQKGFESWGVELSPILVILSKIKIRQLGLKNAKIIWGNFWQVDLSKFDVIYFFQYRKANQLLEQKILREAKSGSVVISYAFPLNKLNLKTNLGPFFIYML